MDQDEVSARRLCADFDVWRQATHWWHATLEEKTKGRLPGPLSYDKHKSIFLSTVKWCREKGLEPRFWLYTLFVARAWRFPVPLKVNMIQSFTEKNVNRYKKAHHAGFFRKRMMHNDGFGEEVVVDPNRDIVPANEAVKATLLREQQEWRCMSLSLTETYGFHPRSPICRACPIKAKCAVSLQSALPFPVIALRNGDITIAQAQMISHKSLEVIQP